MDAGRLLRMLFLLSFLVFELVMGGPKCSGRWAIHSCGGGNGKRTQIEELLNEEASPEDDPLPGFVSDLKALDEGKRGSENYPVLQDGDDERSSLSSDQRWAEESPYGKLRSREDEDEEANENIDRAVDALLTRLFLKRRLMG